MSVARKIHTNQHSVGMLQHRCSRFSKTKWAFSLILYYNVSRMEVLIIKKRLLNGRNNIIFQCKFSEGDYYHQGLHIFGIWTFRLQGIFMSKVQTRVWRPCPNLLGILFTLVGPLLLKIEN